MNDIFVGQTALKIVIETNIILTDATLLLKYRKPDRKTGSFNAIIDPLDDSKMYYDIQSAEDLDQAGIWTFWAHVTFPDSTIGIGSIAKQEIKLEGN
jgi:hypothetical protein